MSYLPIYLEIKGRHCLVIGGGAVAERKIASLLEAGAEVTVISPDASETIVRWSRNQSIHFIARRYQPGDLADTELAFVATDVDAVNAADDPAHCDFILPSVLRRGDLTVAVSTGGTSPALARTIREELELYFTPEYEMLVTLAAEVREELRAQGISLPFEAWRRALSGEVRQLLMRGDIARAKSLLLKELGVPV